MWRFSTESVIAQRKITSHYCGGQNCEMSSSDIIPKTESE